MSDIVLVLGPVAFSDFEDPERIRFGGAQRLAVHKLPGGARVIDALGPDDTEIGWSGIFAARARPNERSCSISCGCRGRCCC
jgi:hypothetical protein